MTTDPYFRLEGNVTAHLTQAELIERWDISRDHRNLIYTDEQYAPEPRYRTLDGFTFSNVAFSNTRFEGIVFRNVKFENCLFLSTEFVDCEFHNTTFDGCNPYKATFERCYIDPAVFEGVIDKKRHANVGIYLFQQLYSNARNTNQRGHLNTADFNLHKWERYNLTNNRRRNRVGPLRYWTAWSTNVAHYLLLGYGIKPIFFFVWTLLLMGGVIAFNSWQWDEYTVINAQGQVADGSFVKSLFFTVGAVTTAGFGDLSPTSSVGRVVASAEMFIGVVWLGMLASLLVKRFAR